jgi:hypothetical protein
MKTATNKKSLQNVGVRKLSGVIHSRKELLRKQNKKG